MHSEFLEGPVPSGTIDPHNWGSNCDDGMEDFGKLSPPCMINYVLASRSENDCPKVLSLINGNFGSDGRNRVDCVAAVAGGKRIMFGKPVCGC